MKDSSVSIIIPVFNAEKNLQMVCEHIADYCRKTWKNWEIILVDDGSTDQSWGLMNRLALAGEGKIKSIRLRKNYGQHNATFCGMCHSSNDFVITMDDDMQHKPEMIDQMFQQLQRQNLDVVFGIPSARRISFLRSLSRWLLRMAASISDKGLIGSSFRILRKDLVDRICEEKREYIFLEEMILWYTDKYDHIKVEGSRKQIRKSGYTNRKLFGMAWNILVFYSGFPLKLMTRIGIMGSVISGLLGTFFLFKKLLFRAPTGYTSIIVAILFTASALLIGMGILGEYLYRIYKNQNNKPPFSIREIAG